MNRKTTLPNRAAAPTRSRKPLVLALVAALGIAPLAASAATISVTSNADPTASSACTLRAAIVSMNNAAAEPGCVNSGDAFGTHDTIIFDTLVFPTNGSGTITLGGSQLDITASDLTIDASANSNVTIDANHASRVVRDIFGVLSLEHLTLRNGSATATDCGSGAKGGAICAPHTGLHLSNVTLSGSVADVGGGLYTSNSVTLTNSTVTGNTAHENGGGIYATSYAGVVLFASHVSNNYAKGDGGGIWSAQFILLSNSTMTGNSTSGDYGANGGGVYSSGYVALDDNSTASGNSAYHGGGIGGSGGTITLTGSTLSGNTATAGGGIYAKNGTVMLTNSTLSGNSVDIIGGGIFTRNSSAKLTNSTLSGNTADDGGGIYGFGGTVTLSNSTLSGNVAHSKGGGIDIGGTGASVDANNTIVAGNTQSAGGNIEGVTSSGNNNVLSGDPKLGPMADNGGPTQTMLPLSGSAAIDTGACHTAQSDGIPTTDQRGAARPMGSGCDIGAVERYQVNVLRALGRNGQHALAGDVFAQPLVVQTLDSAGHAIKGVIPKVVVPSGGPSAMCVAAPADSTGVARIVCAAGAQIGSYTIHVTAPGLGQTVLSVDYTLTNEPNDRIFGSGFEDAALPTGGVSP